ncbi:hypothetical protein SOVF_040750 [Spinacia oleracea]|uniref:Endosulphine n=1 Tax=Spinacia oleracea TaxID=3562 RepID=A0A9R0I5H8_SPIOL|nr:uncharacterized protein LOC110783004 [Spinacia oleracea]KNA21730.1 hypothetical protein SOVF_040750 [Spinacia oleracea]
MSGTGEESVQEKVVVDQEHQEVETGDAEKNEEHQMPSPQQQEETIKKKYGGILPKKKPLISKDHEHAFFDSADWALGKQGGQKPKGPLEALRPKLQPTYQQARSRRSAYAPADGEDASGMSAEDPDCVGDDDNHEKVVPEV